MKKVLFVFGLLLTLGMFCACSSDDGDNATDDSFGGDSEGTENVLNPIEEGDGLDAITDFFNSELPNSSYSKGFFCSSPKNANVGEKTCIIINSKKELKDIYSGEKELPKIDFQQYSLVIGQVIMPAAGYRCVKQELVRNTINTNLTLNLYVENMFEYNPCIVVPLYYWGLYPKMQLSTVEVNVIML